MVSPQELQRGFGEITVQHFAVLLAAVPSPDQGGGPIAAANRAVVGDGRCHPESVCLRVQFLRTLEPGDGVLSAPVLRGTDRQARRPRVYLSGINVPAVLVRLATVKTRGLKPQRLNSYPERYDVIRDMRRVLEVMTERGERVFTR